MDNRYRVDKYSFWAGGTAKLFIRGRIRRWWFWIWLHAH